MKPEVEKDDDVRSTLKAPLLFYFVVIAFFVLATPIIIAFDSDGHVCPNDTWIFQKICEYHRELKVVGTGVGCLLLMVLACASGAALGNGGGLPYY